MKTIIKIIAIVIENDQLLMVRKAGKDIWTSLGGKLEAGETETEALLREIKEEVGCEAKIIKKIGTFTSPAAFDKAIVQLEAYLVDIIGEMKISDPELEELRFIPKNYRELNIKLPESMEIKVIPELRRLKLLKW